MAKYATENSRPAMRISPRALNLLATYAWPGNVRELERCIEHAVVVAEGPEIRPEHFPREILESLPSEASPAASRARQGDLPSQVRQLERELIQAAIVEAKGVKVMAAKILGIHESTLRKKMRDLHISSPAE